MTDKDRQRLKLLTTMHGITETQQAEIWYLVLDNQIDACKAKCDGYERDGATYAYSKSDVDRMLGKRSPFLDWLIG